MSFGAALGAILTGAGALAWGGIALTLVLAFAVLLLDGAAEHTGPDVAPLVIGGVLVTAALGIFAWWCLVGHLFLSHGVSGAHVVAAVVCSVALFALTAAAAKIGAKIGARLRARLHP